MTFNIKTVNPKISVIIPVYNAQIFLHKCINSILTQNFTDFELLLIDDGSQDDSGKICDEFEVKDRRIRVFHKINEGVSSSRNFGINKANGEWICFVDSDDWLDNGAFQEIISSIENKNVDLVIWGIKLVYDKHIKEIIVPTAGLFNTSTEVSELLIRSDIKGYFGSPCTKLYSSSIIKLNKLYFDNNLSLMEDCKFNYSYFKYISSVFAIPKSYYNYRLGHNSLSLSNNYPDIFLELWRDYIQMRSEFYTSYNGLYKDIFNRLLDKEIEMSYITFTLALYAKKRTAKTRRENFAKILNRGKIEIFKGKSIYYLLKTNNVYIIDTVFKLRYLILKFRTILINSSFRLMRNSTIVICSLILLADCNL